MALKSSCVPAKFAACSRKMDCKVLAQKSQTSAKLVQSFWLCWVCVFWWIVLVVDPQGDHFAWDICVTAYALTKLYCLPNECGNCWRPMAAGVLEGHLGPKGAPLAAALSEGLGLQHVFAALEAAST